jgi:hypothetical protein
MKRVSTYEHPTSYEAIVAFECSRHERRLRELKRSEKAIRAIREDLYSLAKSGLKVDVGEFSLYLIDHKVRFGTNRRSKTALYINTGVFRETADRFVVAFMNLGWTIDAVNGGSCGQVLLRRPKTEVRIVLDLSEKFATELQAREVTQ